jgi:uncharacterized hydrophobic protein (TIGR00271 family)
MEKKKEDNVFKVTRSNQYRTVEELLDESKPSLTYYTLLILSSIIVVCGILLGNAPVIIGGMLVTPMLTPVLALALAFSTGEPALLKPLGVLLGKSFGFVVVVSCLVALIFGVPQEAIFDNSARTVILYFVVAVISGIAATFAWAHKEIAAVLPGIAIAVSLVPPISAVGVWLSVLDFDAARFFFFVFFANLLGIVMGSIVVFSLLRFYKADRKIKEKSEEIAQGE